MRNDWETQLSVKLECDSSVRTLAGIFRATTPEDKKKEPVPEKIGRSTYGTRTTPEH
jgi:hypothetical protein